MTPEAERLIEEGNAILATLDEFNEREEVERTMGNMATSSYRSDMFRRAMVKFDEALDVLKKGRIDE